MYNIGTHVLHGENKYILSHHADVSIDVKSDQGSESNTTVIATSSTAAAVTLLLAAIIMVFILTLYILIKKRRHHTMAGPVRYSVTCV